MHSITSSCRLAVSSIGITATQRRGLKVHSLEVKALAGHEGVPGGSSFVTGHAQQQLSKAVLEVPGVRVVEDNQELDWIGSGLPVIQPARWPDIYSVALEQIASNQPIPVPKPHPKFNEQDLIRLSEGRLLFSDLVLPHAERLDSAVALSFNYIPTPILGDFRGEVEPNWDNLPQISIIDLFQGLRARTWSSSIFNPSTPLWKLQFFQCGYQGQAFGWPGWRALVTADGVQCWVPMPDAGHMLAVTDQVDNIGGLGYQAIFQQLYAAFAEKLPHDALKARVATGFVPESGVQQAESSYQCPADALLDVSYHLALDGRPPSALAAWLMEPSWSGVNHAIRTVVDNSGIAEVKALRDRLLAQLLPVMPRVNVNFSGMGAGPLYFLVVLVAGIVLPAVRRARVMDISTLEEDPGAAMEFARSKSSARKEGLTGTEFADVAGLDPILNEVLEVVEFLKAPKTFSKLGARPPKGILLEGDPGTGKTLLAKALAGEAMVPFYQMAGTEFTEGIVGLGAARVRDLFKRARANAPCVIFVDELDALGMRRAERAGKANEEREQTLNQLLTEMDGFTPDVGVVFIGATNRADLLDPALMRPGRFDRKIRMPKPDTEGRYDILKLHLRNKKVDPNVDLLQLARDLPGLVGADLANIVNEAQMTALRDGRQVLTMKDLFSGVDRFTAGDVRLTLPRRNKQPVTVFAAKEVGTALLAWKLRQRHGRIEPVERVSIQPKGGSFSRTLFARGTDEEYHIITRGKMLDRIKLSLAPHISVRLVLGQETNLSVPDLEKAWQLAQKFVFYYSFSEWGITTWGKQAYSKDFFPGSARPRKVVSTTAMDAAADWPTRDEDYRFDPLDPSDPMWHMYQDQVRKVLIECYAATWRELEAHRDALWAGVKALVEAKEMLGKEMRDVFDQYPPKPEEDPLPAIGYTTFTKGREEQWPYGMDWLNDVIDTPYWIQQQQQGKDGGKVQGAGSKSIRA